MWRPSPQRRRGGRRVLALLVLGPLLYGCEPGLAPAPRPQPPPAIAWQAMGQTVALHLTQAGVPPAYVPALTQEYLGACQVALLQGATMPQAEAFATYHLAQLLQHLRAQGSGGPGASQPGTTGAFPLSDNRKPAIDAIGDMYRRNQPGTTGTFPSDNRKPAIDAIGDMYKRK